MNTRSFIKLFVTLVVLVGAQIVSKTPEASQNVVPQIADGGSCIPWTPTTCMPPAAKQQELADGGSCIPWTPTRCIPGTHREWQPDFQPVKSEEVADGGSCIPWTPETCKPMKAGRHVSG